LREQLSDAHTLISKLERLETVVIKLEARIKELEHKKDSKNSSIPPSKDENRKTKSLRKKSGKKTGGQLGHKGNTLKMLDQVDQVEEHSPDFCQVCASGLNTEKKLRSRRQVIDIPPIKPIVTEHRVYENKCVNCGHINCGSFPDQVKSPISYGNGIMTLIAYLSVRQYISMNRIQEILGSVFNVKMSEGTVKNQLSRYANKCNWICEQIRHRLLRAHWIGTDETGYRLNGKKAWMWTWQNDKYTLLHASTNRGTQTINEVYPHGLANSILVHDCWKPHFNTACQTHQLCLVHLLRELEYFIEKRSIKWAYAFAKLLRKSIQLKHKITEEQGQGIDINKSIQNIEDNASSLIDQEIKTNNKKLLAFQKRMKKYSSYLFTFLHHESVPYENNSSERAIRNMKVKMKVSGMFKTYEGAQNFAIIRSVMDTCAKNNKNIFSALSLVPE
jgi:transposase